MRINTTPPSNIDIMSPSVSENVLLTAPVTDDASVSETLMQSASLTLKFSRTNKVVLPPLSYISYGGQVLYLHDTYEPKYTDGIYSYTPSFISPEYLLDMPIFRRYWTNSDDDETSESDFTVNMNLKTAMEMIETAILRWNSNVKKLYPAIEDILPSLTISYKDIDPADTPTSAFAFSNVTILEALKSIASIFDIEWHFSFTSNAVTLILGKRITNGKPTLSMLSSDFISYTPQSSDVAPRFLTVYGSERNIKPSQAIINGQSVTAAKRLQLDPSMPLPESIRSFAEMTQEGQIHFFNVKNVKEEVKVYDDIYPKYVGAVSGVRTRPAGDRSFYYIKDSAIDFPISLLPGLNLTIKFESGALNGMEFKANYNSANREFELISNEDYGIPLPGGSLVPVVGDKYIPYNFVMPQTYVTKAKQELLAKAALDAAELIELSPAVTCITAPDKIHMYPQLPSLLSDIAIQDIDNSPVQRVTEISWNLTTPYDITFTLSNVVPKGIVQQLKDELNTAVLDNLSMSARLNEYASDNLLSPREKLIIKTEIDNIKAGYPLVISNMDMLEIRQDSIDGKLFINAYNALIDYISPIIADLSSASDIDADEFTSKFEEYYTRHTKIQEISDSKKQPNLLKNQTGSSPSWESGTYTPQIGSTREQCTADAQGYVRTTRLVKIGALFEKTAGACSFHYDYDNGCQRYGAAILLLFNADKQCVGSMSVPNDACRISIPETHYVAIAMNATRPDGSFDTLSVPELVDANKMVLVRGYEVYPEFAGYGLPAEAMLQADSINKILGAMTNDPLGLLTHNVSNTNTIASVAKETANAAKTTADNALPSASFTQENLVSKLGTTYLKPSEFNAKLQADDTFKTAQTNITTAKNKADTAYDRATSAGQAAVSAQETADSAQSTATEAKNGLALKLDTSKAGETLVAQMSINSSGKWVANGVVLGQATGAQGPQGEAGAKGADGKTWKPTVATDGTLTWAQDTSTTAPTSRNIRGPQGVQGVAGAKGDKGQSGIVDKVKNANLVSYNRILQAGFTYATLFDGEWFTIKTNLLETQTYTAKKDMFGLVYKENTQYAITATADERWTWRINIYYTDGTTDKASLSFNGSTAQVTKQVITASGKTVDRLTGYWTSSVGQAKMRVKIEEGTTYTAWSPSPDDATDTMRLYDSQGIIEITNNNYTKFQVTYSGTNYIEPAKLGRTVLFGSGYSQSSTTVNFEYPEKYEGREMTVINNSSVEIAYRGCMQPVTDDTPNWDSAALPYCSTYTQPPKTLCVWKAARYKTKIDSTYVSGISWFLYDIKDYF